MNIPSTCGEVGEGFFVESGEVLSEAFFQGFWECDDAVFSAFAVMYRDGALSEIEIFDTQSHGFHQTEATAISGVVSGVGSRSETY